MADNGKRLLELLGLDDIAGDSVELQQEITDFVVQAATEKFKKMTAFRDATQDTIFVKLGLQLQPDWQPPSREFVPSERLNGILEDIKKYWGLSSEKAKRTVIDMLLLDILVVKKDCKVWCEVPLKTDKVYGRLDYAVGKLSVLTYPTGPYVVVLEGKKEWVVDDQFQLMAEMYACLKTNKNEKPVFGALTNETNWQFFKLDTELNIYRSVEYLRHIQMKEILGILYAMFFTE